MKPSTEPPDDGLGCLRGVKNGLPIALVCWLILAFIGCPRVGHAQELPRPVALTPLEISLGTLQGLDLWTTDQARVGHARESNPIMAPIIDSKPATIGVKIATTAAVIAIAERWRKDHPKVAIAFLIGANAAMTAVVAHNVDVIRQQRSR